MKKMILKASILAQLAITFSVVGAQEKPTLIYNGEVEVIGIQPEISTTSTILAGVKAYDFQIDNKTSICRFVSDEENSVVEGDRSNWTCHFEWTSDVAGINNLGRTIQGTFPEPGMVEIPYRVSVYSGNDRARVEVANGVYSFEVHEAEGPVISNLAVDWSSERLTGKEQFLGFPESKLSSVRFTLEQRDYSQKVEFEGSQCIVQEGREECHMFLDQDEIASLGDHGSETKPIGLNSVSNYFEDIKDALSITYDYRPVEFSDFIHNDTLEQLDYTFDLGGNELTLGFNQAAVIYNAHQAESDIEANMVEEGLWWLPRESNVRLNPKDESAPSNYKEVLSKNRFFSIPYFSGSREISLNPISTEVMNGQVAFIYDISQVSDGLYNANVDARNSYRVGSPHSYSEDTILSRFPPEIEFFNSRTTIREQADIYFASDIAIAAHGGWDDGTHISGVLINGEPVEFESYTDDPQVVHITNQVLEGITLGETFELTALAVNDKGWESTKSVELRYAPVSYQLTSVPTELFKKVEPMRVGVRRSGGTNCSFVSSAEVAHEIATTSRYACYPVWHYTPEGTTPMFSGQSPFLYGAIRDDADHVSIGLDVVYVSYLGEEVTISTPTESIKLLEPKPIDLGFVGQTVSEDGTMTLPEGSRILGRAMLGFTRGVVEYEVSYSDGEPYTSRSISSSREYSEGNIRINAKAPFEHEVFSENEVTVRAWYRYAPEMSKEVVEPFLLTPNDSSRFVLSSEVTEGNTLETLNLEANLEKQYERQWTSDPSLIGEYNVYIAKQAGRNNYEQLTEAVPLVNGKASFELDLSSNMDIGNNTLFAIATLNEPEVANYEDEIVSRRLGFYLFSGEAIEGELNARTLQGPIPMRARVSYQAASLHEVRLIEEYIWEVSQDGGSTWHRDESVTNHSFSKSHDEAADYMVRVRVRNRLTGLESTSEEVRIIAYHTPRIQIDGPSAIYKGLPETYKISTRTSDLTSDDGRFFWSYDGNDWFEGDNELTVELEDSTRLYARYISHSADGRDLERSAEVEATRNIQVRSLAPVRINASLPNLIEAGSLLEFDAEIRQPINGLDYPVAIEWVDSKGNVYENGYQYEVTQADINEDNSAEFTVRSWMVGLRDATYAERQLRTRPWHYETPDIRVEVRNSHQIAPVNIRLGIAHETVFAPFVELEYDWELPEGASIARDASGGRYINVDFLEPGVYEIKGILRDSRGGEVVAYEYIDILEPAEMEPEIELRFSEQNLRPPLRVVARMTVQRTHPDDRVDHIIWYKNGEPIEDSRSTGYFDLDEVGTYELTGEVHTRLGQVASVIETVTLVPNQHPICQPEVSETSSVYRVETNCTDPDGRIIRYEWEWGEGVSNQNRPTLSFAKNSYESLSVTFRAYDDSGDFTEGAVSW